MLKRTLTLLSATLSFSYAASIPVSGTLTATGGIGVGFNISGPGFAAQSATTDWMAFLGTCSQNSTCDITLEIPASRNFHGPQPGYSSGSLQGIDANLLGGVLTIRGSGLVPQAPFNLNTQVIMPMTVTGSITGYNLTCNHLCEPSPALWTVNISGAGTLNLSGISNPPRDVFLLASTTLTGTATPVPEPASITLFAAGLLVVGLSRLRARHRSHR
jgi:hypothetical protein